MNRKRWAQQYARNERDDNSYQWVLTEQVLMRLGQTKLVRVFFPILRVNHVKSGVYNKATRAFILT